MHIESSPKKLGPISPADEESGEKSGIDAHFDPHGTLRNANSLDLSDEHLGEHRNVEKTSH